MRLEYSMFKSSLALPNLVFSIICRDFFQPAWLLLTVASLAIVGLSNQMGLMKWFLKRIHPFLGEVDKYINSSTLVNILHRTFLFYTKRLNK